MLKACERLFLVVFVCLVTSVVVQTQTDPPTSNACAEALDAAITAAMEGCDLLGRNQACYGHVNVVSTLQEGVSATFEQIGDRIDITELQTLYTVPFDPETGEWGIALMKLQANLPDTLPGQNVTFVLFGDVEITNESLPPAGEGEAPTPAPSPTPPPTLTPCAVSASSNLNVRSGPGTNDAIVGSITPGQEVMATARNDVGDWLRISLDDDTSGWVYAPLATATCDTAVLPVVIVGNDSPTIEPEPPNVPVSYDAPMQVFSFRTGIGTSEHTERCLVPPSAIIVQAPQGTTVNFQANGVDIVLGSTMVLQSAQDAPFLSVLLEGAAQITAQDKTATLVEGAQAVVYLDESNHPDRTPGVIPYIRKDFEGLQEGDALTLLPYTVELPDPATATNVINSGCDGDWIPSPQIIYADEPVIIGSLVFAGTVEQAMTMVASSQWTVTLDGVALEDFQDFGLFVSDWSPHAPIIEPGVETPPEVIQELPAAWVVYYPAGFLEPGAHLITFERRIITGFIQGTLNGEPLVREPGMVGNVTCNFSVIER